MKNKNTIATLNDFAERVKDQMIENLFNNRSFDTGTLAKSIVTENASENNLESTISVNAWYGIVVEEGIGRKAGKMPPIAPIKNWIRKRSITPKPGTTVEQLSFAIAKKIAKSGSNPKARPFAAPAVQQVKQNFGDFAIIEAVGEDLELNINDEFKKSGAKVS